MRCQTTTTQRIGGVLSIGSCRQKVSTQRKENFGLPLMHGLNRAHRVVAMTAWWFKIEFGPQLVEKGVSGSFPNSHCAIALDVAVPPDRAQARAWFANLPAEQHQVNDLLNVSHRVLVLRQAHGPTENCSFRINENFRSVFDMRF